MRNLDITMLAGILATVETVRQELRDSCLACARHESRIKSFNTPTEVVNNSGLGDKELDVTTEELYE